MKKIILTLTVLFASTSLTACSKPAEGQDLAKAACQAWQVAWSNSIRLYIGDARSQYYDFDGAYDIAKTASDLNAEWQPITNAISKHVIYLASSFDNSLFPDSAEQVKGMDVCEKLGVDVMDS